MLSTLTDILQDKPDLPTEMMKAFERPEIEPVAKEVEDVIVAMMQEVGRD